VIHAPASRRKLAEQDANRRADAWKIRGPCSPLVPSPSWPTRGILATWSAATNPGMALWLST
jgi:hypothetical protein